MRVVEIQKGPHRSGTSSPKNEDEGKGKIDLEIRLARSDTVTSKYLE